MKRVLIGALVVAIVAALAVYGVHLLWPPKYLSMGEDFSWGDQALYHQLYDSQAPFFDKPVAPKWTEAQAIAAATHYLAPERAKIKVTLGPPSAKFDQAEVNTKYYPGRWMIDWPRVDSKGHVFEDDRVTMEIPDGLGPVGISVHQDSLYAEESGSPMSASEALDKARRLIASDAFWANLDLFHRENEWTEVNPTWRFLWIVHPMHDKSSPSRLAWAFWFKRHSPAVPITHWLTISTLSTDAIWAVMLLPSIFRIELSNRNFTRWSRLNCQ